MSDLPIDDDAFDPDMYDDPEPRRGRGFLATDVNITLKEWLAGEFSLQEGKFMTPYIVARIIKEKDGLEKMPSSGAITRIFHTWEDWGYAEFRQTPFAFIDFTPEGKELGLQAFTDRNKSVLRSDS